MHYVCTYVSTMLCAADALEASSPCKQEAAAQKPPTRRTRLYSGNNQGQIHQTQNDWLKSPNNSSKGWITNPPHRRILSIGTMQITVDRTGGSMVRTYCMTRKVMHSRKRIALSRRFIFFSWLRFTEPQVLRIPWYTTAICRCRVCVDGNVPRLIWSEEE